MEFVDAKFGASIKHYVRLTLDTGGVVSRFPVEDYNFTAKVLEKGAYIDIADVGVTVATTAEIAALPNTDATKVGVLTVVLPGSTDKNDFAMRSGASEVRLIGTAKADGRIVEVLPAISVTRS